MKIPLAYPKIPSPANCPLKKCIAFEKIDGSNLHYLWNNGWVAFGTRRNRYNFNEKASFCNDHPKLAESILSFIEKLMPLLSDRLKELNIDKAIIFTEYAGEKSFAGQHIESDSSKHHTLIDVEVNGKITPPSDFISNFIGLPLPKVIYQGKYTGQFVEDVRNGKYPVNEGVVVKGIVDGKVYMTKIKTNAYLQRLKEKFKYDWEDYYE